MNTLQKSLRRLGACREAVAWAAAYDTLDQAWAACTRGDWMLWLWGMHAGEPMSEARRPLVGACCTISRMSLDIFEKKHSMDRRPREAIELAERFANGQPVTQEEMRLAARAAADAAYAATDTARAAAYAAYAAYAAAAAADAAYATYAMGAAATAAYAADVMSAAAIATYIATADAAHEKVRAALDRVPKGAIVVAGIRNVDDSLAEIADIIRTHSPKPVFTLEAP